MCHEGYFWIMDILSLQSSDESIANGLLLTHVTALPTRN